MSMISAEQTASGFRVLYPEWDLVIQYETSYDKLQLWDDLRKANAGVHLPHVVRMAQKNCDTEVAPSRDEFGD